jgi:hypothetical protein
MLLNDVFFTAQHPLYDHLNCPNVNISACELQELFNFVQNYMAKSMLHTANTLKVVIHLFGCPNVIHP